MKPSSRMPVRTELAAGILVALIAGFLVFLGVSVNRNTGTSPSGQVMTLDPTTLANLTRIAPSVELEGEVGDQIRSIQAQIQACKDYPPQRLQTMEQYIQWLFNPDSIPGELVIAFSPDPTARLLFAIAADTSTEWRRLQRPADSCLVPIGRQLNDLLLLFGQDPITVYDE